MSKLLALAVVLPAAAALAAGPKCSDGRAARLNGDAFSPVDCSTTTKPVPALPGAAAAESADVPADLKALEGRWTGSFAHALGRYDAVLTVKTSWGGKADLTFDLTELQFHQKLTDVLALKPAKGRGAYDAELTTTLAPGASLKGALKLGVEPSGVPVAVSTGAAKAPPPLRQADLTFANGAAHRVGFRLEDKDSLTAFWFMSVPGAPPQKLRLSLRRAAKR